MWDLNLGVQACQKNFKPFRHRNAYASIYSVYKKYFFIYINITIGLKKLALMRINRQWCLYILKNSFIYWINRSICIPMSKWLEIFLASLYTQIKIPHRILGFSNHFFINYIFLCAECDKEDEFHLGPNRFFSSASTKFLSLGHIRACVKV